MKTQEMIDAVVEGKSPRRVLQDVLDEFDQDRQESRQQEIEDDNDVDDDEE